MTNLCQFFFFLGLYTAHEKRNENDFNRRYLAKNWFAQTTVNGNGEFCCSLIYRTNFILFRIFLSA